MQNSKRRIITQTTKREKLTQQIQFKNNSKFQKQQHQSDTREKTVLTTKKRVLKRHSTINLIVQHAQKHVKLD